MSDPQPISILFDLFERFRSFLLGIWWLWLFPFLVFTAQALWRGYIQEHYRRAIKWSFFELKVPREVMRSPRAMEQVFFTIHQLRNSAGSLKEKWWEGVVTQWFSCEIVSIGGEIRFFMRVPASHHNVIEASLYANYPDIETAEVDTDYTNRFPSAYQELHEKGYELFGSEFLLAKKDVYPIRTYVDFEEKVPEYQLDPIATLLETIGKGSPEENYWIQILIRPRDDSWKKEGEKEIEEIREKAKIKIEGPNGTIESSGLSPGFGPTELIKAIDRSISKPGFDVVIRYVYISPKDRFDNNLAKRGILASFNQYASETLNKFKNNGDVATEASPWFYPYVFPVKRTLKRKRRLYRYYRERRINREGIGSVASGHNIVLTVEELATIYHLPTNVVLTSQTIKTSEARKIGPPQGLSIFGEEGEAERMPGMKK